MGTDLHSAHQAHLADPAHPARLEQIDVLRGLAALAVVVFHYSGHLARYMGFPFHLEIGKYGVQMFFVISGFFIFATVEKCRTAREFLLLRFSRLYPVYWATLLILLAFQALTSDAGIWWTSYVVNASMLQSFLGVPDLDIVFWSLAVEMVFYLLMAVLMATRAIRRPLVVSLVWLALCNLWPLLANHPLAQSSLVKTFAGVLVYGPFFAGGLMFYLLQKTNWTSPARPLAVLGLCVVTAWLTGWVGNGVVAAVILLLMGLALRGHLRGLVSPVTLWLGAISYSLYLIHRNLGYAALFKLQAWQVDNWLALAIVMVGALGLASALTYWVEKPSLRYFRAWLRPPSKPA